MKPPDFDENLADAVCALNLACEDHEGAVLALPTDLAAAISKLREVAFPPCPGCSQAGGAGLPVCHYPPLCTASDEQPLV
jgi:hypothetical protein